MIGKLGFVFSSVKATALVVLGAGGDDWSGEGTALYPLVGPSSATNLVVVATLKTGILWYAGQHGDGTLPLFYEISRNGSNWSSGYAAAFSGGMPVSANDSVTFYMSGNMAVDTWSLYVD